MIIKYENISGTTASCGANMMILLNKSVSYKIQSKSDNKTPFDKGNRYLCLWYGMKRGIMVIDMGQCWSANITVDLL